MKICICGGGSLGHVCAGILSEQSRNEVNIFSGHPEKWCHNITISDNEGKIYQGNIHKISNNPQDVLINQDIILFCLPGFLIRKTLETIKPYIGNAVVGSIVSSTGFFFEAHKILNNETKLFGFQRVPYIARVNEYGKSAFLLGYKDNLKAALENIEKKQEFCNQLSILFKTSTSLLDNYLEAALTNSNPILHTGRLFSMFHGKENNIFNHNILFYHEWTDEASDLLIEMDKEFFALLKVLNINNIPTLLDYYESSNSRSLTNKLSNIPAFMNITSPMIQVNEGWKIDFKSRYFTEDFPFGLRWIYELGKKYAINMPNISKVYNWGIRQINTTK